MEETELKPAKNALRTTSFIKINRNPIKRVPNRRNLSAATKIAKRQNLSIHLPPNPIKPKTSNQN